MDSATLMVAKSLLLDAGIPFIARGERLQELVEPGRIGTNFSVPLGTVKLQVRTEDVDEAREILRIEDDKIGSEERVKELEQSFIGQLIWFAVFFLIGFAIAYFIVPGTWDRGQRILIYVAASISSVFLGTAIRKSRGYDQIDGEKPVFEGEESPQPSTGKKKLILALTILILFLLFLFYYFGTNTEKEASNNYNTSDIMKNLAYYKKKIVQNPDDAINYLSAGTAYLMLKSTREALPYLNKAVELDPVCVDCLYNRGVAHYQLGNYDQTVKDYSRIIELDPHNKKITDVYYGRVDAFYADHRYWEAIKDYDKTIDLDPKKIKAYLFRGVLL